jgi:hypothetical protein
VLKVIQLGVHHPICLLQVRLLIVGIEESPASVLVDKLGDRIILGRKISIRIEISLLDVQVDDRLHASIPQLLRGLSLFLPTKLIAICLQHASPAVFHV